ncbi:MAG: penicillin-binding protein activator LpoB [Spirochaetaceae bacterium]|jgi:uncharacterized protein (TIGR02722 family)|nr:penicillin-binding protein activator LpoB [Spirochaetaceae bacterium]
MKKYIIFAVFCAAFFAGCSSNPKVERIDSGKIADKSGYWNDTDARIVCESLIKDCLSNAKMNKALARRGSKTPKVLVGEFRNNTSEHINTAVITTTMETAIFNSGKLDFVAGGSERDSFRKERIDQNQSGFTSDATAKALANETGADFVLTGSIESIIDEAGNQVVRTYFVNARMTDLETNERVWMAQNSSIKKIVTRPKAKF